MFKLCLITKQSLISQIYWVLCAVLSTIAVTGPSCRGKGTDIAATFAGRLGRVMGIPKTPRFWIWGAVTEVLSGTISKDYTYFQKEL